MKIKIIFLFAISILFTNCKNEDVQLNNSPNVLDLNSININEFGFDYEGRPYNALTYKEVVAMLHQYDVTRAEVLDNSLGKEDNRSVFFSKPDLKSFITEVESISAEKNINFSGISLLSSAYPIDYEDIEQRGKRTLILMPYTDVNGKNIVFEPLESSNNKAKTFMEVLEEFKIVDSKTIMNNNMNKVAEMADVKSIGFVDEKLSYKQIISMLAAYNSNKATDLEFAIGKEDVRKTSIDLKTLKNYLAYIEKLSTDKNIELSGIKLLFGAYPDNYIITPIKSNYMSVIFMPTTKVNGKDVMFEPLYSEMDKPLLFTSLLKNEYGYDYYAPLNARKKFSFNQQNRKGIDEDLDSSGSNRGTVSPPY